MSENTRKTWLDAARGLAMVFVIFGHVGNELVSVGMKNDAVFNAIAWFINPVKVPLFFAISGYLFSMHQASGKTFAIKMLKSRLFPYVIWASFMGIAAFCVDFMQSGCAMGNVWTLLLENWLVPLVRGNLIWFIPCLIVTEILFFFLCKGSRNKMIWLMILSALCTVLGYRMSADAIVKPWKWDTALCCVQFMCFGRVFRMFLEEKQERIPGWLPMGLYIGILIVCQLIWKGCRVDINMGTYFNRPAFTVLSLAGIYAFFAAAKYVERIRPLCFVGRNTFVYFVWHMYAVKSVILIGKRVFMTGMPMWMTAVSITALACIAVALVCDPVNRYFAFSVGKTKRRDG